MAEIYKILDQNKDVSPNNRVVLNEHIPISGSILSGTYGHWPADENVKDFTHKMFQSVYDYNYLSSSANHVYDLTFGVHASSALYTGLTNQQSEKNRIYNSLAQVSVGRNESGELYMFDLSGNLNVSTASTSITEALVINFSRLLTKDRIQPGKFTLTVGTSSFATPFSASYAAAGGVNKDVITFNDAHATGSAFVYEYFGGQGSYLYASGACSGPFNGGQIFYDLGFAVVDIGKFLPANISGVKGLTEFGLFDWTTGSENDAEVNLDGFASMHFTVTGATINGLCDGFRRRLDNLTMQNVSEINSTIYFCRAGSKEFNYSSNPTYLDANNKVRVKNVNTDTARSYVTTVGLYDDDNDLVAVAKLSEPLEKNPSNEFILRVRLDY